MKTKNLTTKPKQPAELRSSDLLGGAIAKLKAELKAKLELAREARKAAKKLAVKKHYKACKGKDRPYMTERRIFCIECHYTNGWGVCATLSNYRPECYREALEYLRENGVLYGPWAKLPNGEMNMSMFRVMRYHAVRASLSTTYLLRQDDYEKTATQPPNAELSDSRPKQPTT